MDANNILEELRTLYPEDLNKDYNCYWWWTCNTDGSACLRAHSSDPESLVMLLKMYLETCKY